MFEPQQLAGFDLRGLEFEGERAVDVRRGDQLHALQRLDPALRLLRLRGLGAETVDVRAQVCDLPLLLDVRRLLQRERLRVLPLEGRVVAAVGSQRVAVDVDDSRHDGVEKIAVVGDQQQRARIALEPVLEPEHGVEVEVIGRLVEQQQIGARHQRLRQIQPHAPAAGKARHGVVVARGGKAQSRQQRAGARAGTVAACDFETVMQFRQPLAAGVRVGRMIRCGERDVALDRAQLDVAVEHVLDGRQRGRRRLLRHVRHHPGRRHRGITSVGDKFAAQQREQAGLAAAVGADHADLLPGMHRQRRAFEQPSRATRQGQIRDAYHRCEIEAYRGRRREIPQQPYTLSEKS